MMLKKQAGDKKLKKTTSTETPTVFKFMVYIYGIQFLQIYALSSSSMPQIQIQKVHFFQGPSSFIRSEMFKTNYRIS